MCYYHQIILSLSDFRCWNRYLWMKHVSCVDSSSHHTFVQIDNHYYMTKPFLQILVVLLYSILSCSYYIYLKHYSWMIYPDLKILPLGMIRQMKENHTRFIFIEFNQCVIFSVIWRCKLMKLEYFFTTRLLRSVLFLILTIKSNTG